MTEGGQDIDDDALARLLEATTEAIAANQNLRARYIAMAHARGWSQERIAEAAKISQPAVSKRLNPPAKGKPTTE